MKTVFLSLALVAASLSTIKAQVHFGLEAGLNIANMHVEYGDISYSNKPKIGLRFGGLLDCKLSDHLSFQPGIFYAMNGTKAAWTESHSSYSETYSISTLELPINLQYSFAVGTGGHIFVGAGPYFGYNLGGNVSNVSDPAMRSGSVKIGTDKDKDDLKPLDFGLGFNAGYLLPSGLFFRFRFQHGITNETPTENQTIKLSSFGFQVAYLFGTGTPKAPCGSKESGK